MTTRPRGEQLRFESSKTGSYVLDDYLEAAEHGDRSLSDLLADLFNTSGQFRADIFEFREDPARPGFLQFRVGDFPDSTSGWLDLSFSDFTAFVAACQLAQTNAETAEDNAQLAQSASEDARDLAQQWSSNPEDVPVSGGLFSALHHAIKAAASAAAALLSETNAATSASNASTSETNAATSAQTAIEAKEDAEAAAASFTPAGLLADLKTVDGAGSGLDADLLDGQQGSFYQNASNFNAGTIPDAQLPDRLVLADISDDANTTAWTNGWFRLSSTASNSPVAQFLAGEQIIFSNAGNFAGVQFAYTLLGSGGIPQAYLRSRNDAGGGFTGWEKLYHTGNDGPASGLNADLLDDLHAASFGRLDTSNTWSGNQQVNNNLNVSAGYTLSWGGQPVFRADDADEAATPGKLVMRTANGDAIARYFGTTHASSTRTSDDIFYSSLSTDSADWLRKNTKAGMKASLGFYDATDADVLDTASKLALRNAVGDLYARLFRSTYPDSGVSVNALMGRIDASADNYLRPVALASVTAQLGAATTGAQGMMSAADKSKLDGVEAGADVNRAIASLAQAQAGTDNTTVMTPLRTKQAIDANVYAGADQAETVFPIGHPVVAISGNLARNSTASVRIADSDSYFYSTSGTGALLAGTWRARGFVAGSYTLAQRVA